MFLTVLFSVLAFLGFWAALFGILFGGYMIFASPRTRQTTLVGLAAIVVSILVEVWLISSALTNIVALFR